MESEKNNVIREMERKAMTIRKNLLRLCSMQAIHIGGDLSVADVMTALWQYKMNYNPVNPNDESRDRFVLSKGHASAVTSFNQAAIGCFQTEDVFREYATDTGRFSMHSCSLINPYVDVSTGSLGHGMPVACGMAAALRLKGNYTSRVYTVMGDGEQSEGSIWEAAMNAVHYKLGNLVAILDLNGLEADGAIDEITGLGNIAEKYKAFGWNVTELDGNNMEAVINSLDNLQDPDGVQPVILICHTTKGCGVDFMENSVQWHAGRITKEQYEDSIDKLQKRFEEKWGDEIA